MITFVTLVTFFYLYFVLRDLGMAPDLGGYFGFAVALAIPFVALQVLGGIPLGLKANPLDLLFFGMMLIGFYIMVFSPVTTPNQDPRTSYFAVMVAWCVFYLHIAFAPRDSRAFAFVVKATFVLSTLIVVYYSRENLQFSLGIATLSRPEGAEATYQFFALIYLLNFLLMTLYSTPRWIEITFLMGLVVLLLVGSRTDFVVLLIMYVIYKIGNGLKLSTLLSIVLASALMTWVFSLIATSQFNRFTLLLNYGASNNSFLRSLAFDHALDVVAQHPILGDIGNYEPGLYAHQIISIWVDFGLLGFATYLVCLASFGLHAWRHRSSLNSVGGRSGYVALAAILATLAALLVAKSGTYYLVPVVLGLIRWHDRIRKNPIVHARSCPAEPERK